MDALLGVVFVAQLPSHTPEVVCQCLWGEEEISLETAALPQGGEASREASVMVRGASDPRIQHDIQECFGIPGKIFAKLMLPEGLLCNRPLSLEIDAGRRQTTHQHGKWSHLLFVSFPCGVAELAAELGAAVAGGRGASPPAATTTTPSSLPTVATSPPAIRSPASPPEAERPGVVDPLKKVQRFNVVCALDSRLAARCQHGMSTAWQVSRHLAATLVDEEMKRGYLSQEVQRLLGHWPEDSSFEPGLDGLLSELVAGVRERGYRALHLDGKLLCQPSVFPKEESPPPREDQALALACSREDLLQELPLDAQDVMRSVVEALHPTVSLRTLMQRLALPLQTLQGVAQHLIYWRKVRVVEVFHPETRLAVARGVDAGVTSTLAARFEEWLAREPPPPRSSQRSSNGSRPTLATVLAVLARGCSVEDAERRLQSVPDFDRLLEWLVMHGVLAQLATFYHFLAGSAKADCARVQTVQVNEAIRREFCPTRLTDYEVRLLASRVGGGDPRDLMHRFLCRFAAEFCRAHRRADGDRLAAFARSAELGSGRTVQQALNLIANNKDMFVPYACAC